MTNPYEEFAAAPENPYSEFTLPPADAKNPYDEFTVSAPESNPYEEFKVEPPISPSSEDHPIRKFMKSAAEVTFGYDQPEIPSFSDYMKASWGNSIEGLMTNKKVSDIKLPENSPIAQSVVGGVTQMAGDAGAMALGFLAGGGPASPFTATASAFALPAAMRPILMDMYANDGGAKTLKDFWGVALESATEGYKAYLTGLLTHGAGAAAGAVEKGAFKTGSAMVDRSAQVAARYAKIPAEVATMVAADSALHGHVPEIKDFANAAAMIFGVRLMFAGAGKLRKVYVETGKTPMDVLRDTKADPSIKEDLLSSTAIPRAYEPLVQKPATGVPSEPITANWMSEDLFTGKDTAYRAQHVSDGNTLRPSPALTIESLPHYDFALKSGVKVKINSDGRGTYAWIKGEELRGKKPEFDKDRPWLVDSWESKAGQYFLIGTAKKESSGALEHIVVSKDFQRQGLATELIKEAEKYGLKPFESKDRSVQGAAFLEDLRQKKIAASQTQPTSPPPPAAGSGGSGTPTSRVLSRISIGDKPEKKMYNFEDAYRDYVDRLYYVGKATKEMAGGRTLPMSEDPYIGARKLASVSSKGTHFIEYGTFDPRTLQETGPSLKAILDPVKDNLDEFRAFAVSTRALELDQRGIVHGIDSADAAAVSRKYKRQYGPVLKELQSYQDKLVDYLVQSGVVGRDLAALMRDANKDYVPFFRVMDEESVGLSGTGKKIQASNPIKKIKGSDRLIIDPIESIIGNTFRYIALAEKNMVVRSLVDLSERSAIGGQFVERVPAKMRPIKLSDEEVSKVLQKHGIDPASVPQEDFTIFRPNANFLSDTEIALFRDGKREVYKVDPELGKAFKNLNSDSVGLLTRILAVPAKMLRAGTTLSPEFAMRNVFRDQGSALAFGKGYIPFFDALNGFSSLIKKDQAYRDWLKAGGAQATVVTIDRNYLQESMGKILTDSPVLNLIKNPLLPLRMLSDAFENSTRLGLYKRALGAATDKESKMRAAWISREGTLDFSRKGARMASLNMIDAFLNPTVQGLDRIPRGFMKNPVATAMKIAAGITVPSVLLYLSNRDDPRYQNLSQWIKDLYWVIPMDKWIDISDNPGMYAPQKDTAPYLFKQEDGRLYYNEGALLKLPKPQELGLLFGTAAERFTEWVISKDPKAFDDLMKQIGEAAMPNIIPNFAAPFIEVYSNRSLFTGSPLIPADREGMLPEYQYQHYTSELTKKIGSLVASVPGMKESQMASPANIDSFIRAWSGQLGVTAVNIADAALRKAGALPDTVKPASTLADIPVIKAFIIRNPSMGMKQITDYYNNHAKNQKYITTIQKLIKEGRGQDAIRELRLRQTAMFQLNGLHDAMSNINKTIRYVEANENIPPEEKRQLIDGMYYKLNSMAGMGNEAYERLESSSKGGVSP